MEATAGCHSHTGCDEALRAESFCTLLGSNTLIDFTSMHRGVLGRYVGMRGGGRGPRLLVPCQ